MEDGKSSNLVYRMGPRPSYKWRNFIPIIGLEDWVTRVTDPYKWSPLVFSNGPVALYQWCPCAKGTKAKAPRITYLRRIRR